MLTHEDYLINTNDKHIIKISVVIEINSFVILIFTHPFVNTMIEQQIWFFVVEYKQNKTNRWRSIENRQFKRKSITTLAFVHIFIIYLLLLLFVDILSIFLLLSFVSSS
jgi:hypothetical protein